MTAVALLLAKGAISGAVVSGILAASRRGNAALAGLLVSAPIVTTLTVVFIGFDGGGRDVHRLGGAAVAGVAAYFVFPFVLWASCRRGHWRRPLLLATLAWCAAALCLVAATGS